MTIKRSILLFSMCPLLACAALGSSAVASSGPSYRLVGKAIIEAEPSVHGTTYYGIVFRLNRQIPRRADGSIEGAVNVGGAGSSLGSLGAHSHACYGGEANRRSYTTGVQYTFAASIGPSDQHPTATLHGRATVKRYQSVNAASASARRALGC
jgi:hypothetical protein